MMQTIESLMEGSEEFFRFGILRCLCFFNYVQFILQSLAFPIFNSFVIFLYFWTKRSYSNRLAVSPADFLISMSCKENQALCACTVKESARNFSLNSLSWWFPTIHILIAFDHRHLQYSYSLPTYLFAYKSTPINLIRSPEGLYIWKK